MATHIRTDKRSALGALLRDRYNAGVVVLCGSGTQALQLALGTVRAPSGRPPRVALPAFACFDIVTAAVGIGAGIEFYDVDPHTLGPNPASLARALAWGVDALVVVHLYGIPVDWAGIHDLATTHGTVVIEDAAQGHGGALHSRALGALGATAVLSFGRGKGWTGACGGALLHRGKRVGEPTPPGAVREIGALAGAAAQWALAGPRLYAVPASLPFLGLGETRYHEPRAPEGMTRTAAALLLASDERARSEAGYRRRVGHWYHERLQGLSGVGLVYPPAGAEPGYLRFPIMLEGPARDAALEARARKLGIARSYPLTLPKLPAARRLAAHGVHTYPGAERLARGLFTLPTHSRLNDADRDAVLRAITR